MKIVCDACSAKYSIADEKVRGKVFKIRCKRCSNIIVVRGNQAEEPQEEQHYNQQETRTYGYDEGGGPPDDAVWHLVIDQDQVGPMTEAEVRERFSRGEVDLDTYAWREGFANWAPLGEVEQFASLAQAGHQAGVADDPAAGMFGGPPVDEHATAQSDPADLFAAAGGGVGGDDAASDLFGSAPQGADQGLFGGNGASAPAAGGGLDMSEEAERKLRGERNENSVLFSLNNLAALASDSPKSAPARPAPSSSPASASSSPLGGRTTASGEGSGLIDIRSIAQAYMGPSGSSSGASTPSGSDTDLPVFGSSSFGTASPVLLPTQTPANSNNKTLYIMLGIIGALVVSAAVLVILVIKGGDKPQVAANTQPPPTGDVADKAGQDKAGQDKPDDKTDNGAKPPDKDTTATSATNDSNEDGTSPPDKSDDDKKDDDSSSKPSASRPSSRKRSSSRRSKKDDEPKVTKKDPPKRSSGGCLDEVGCLLADNPPSCCSKYTGKSGKSSGGSSSKSKSKSNSNLPERLSKSDIQSGIGKVRGRVVACGSKHPGKGQVKVSIKVAPSGSVSSTTVKKSPNASLGNCVASAVKRAKFPKSQKGSSFSYPFVF